MRACLVSAPTATEFRDPEELNSEAARLSAFEPPLGILSLAAVLEREGEAPAIVDLNRAYLEYARAGGEVHDGGFAQAAAELIAAHESALYGFSSICSSFPLTIRIAGALKQLRPRATVVLGGPQASVVDVATLASFPFVDLVLRGEAERTLPMLLQELAGGLHLNQVPGLTYRESTQIRRTRNAPVIEDLDSLPTAGYHLTEYLQGASTAALEMGRGCPFACTFCSTNDFFRRNFRLRSPARILSDMRWIAERYSVRDFDLVHDMFTVDRRRVAQFCDVMIESGEEFTWACSARTDCIDEALLQLMAQSGCRSIFYGIETGSQRMQKVIDKHLEVDKARRIVDATERFGIRSTVSLITGFPEETWEDVRGTLRVFMHSARCSNSAPQLNLLAPLAGTPVHSRYKNELNLEGLCSDMSHQGRSQHAGDLELIRNYPDIFPNFYLLPTPHLDREILFELHEFVKAAVERFRFLLAALDQCVVGTFDLLLQWREYRQCIRPHLRGSDLRQYYRTPAFRAEFLSFVRQHLAGKHDAVDALLACELAIGDGEPAEEDAQPDTIGEDQRPYAPPCWDDVLVLAAGTRVLELACDLQEIAGALKRHTRPRCVREATWYATRPAAGKKVQLVKVSAAMAGLLQACDGKRNLAELAEALSACLEELSAEARTYALVRMVEVGRDRGFLRIRRALQPGSEASKYELAISGEHC